MSRNYRLRSNITRGAEIMKNPHIEPGVLSRHQNIWRPAIWMRSLKSHFLSPLRPIGILSSSFLCSREYDRWKSRKNATNTQKSSVTTPHSIQNPFPLTRYMCSILEFLPLCRPFYPKVALLPFPAISVTRRFFIFTENR